MPLALLTDRTVIAISGEDRLSFLQGLITNDVHQLTQGNAIYAAMLTAQGKFLHDFFLIPQAGTLLMDIHAGHAEAIMARLSSYRLRAKVQWERTDLSVHAYWDVPPPEGYWVQDPRLEAMGWRGYGASWKQDAGLETYHDHRIQLGVPDGAIDMLPEHSLLLEFEFEHFHGVSFSKGCYVGQEVTARSKFRGQVRKKLCRVSASVPMPALGTPIISDGLEIGQLRSSSGHHGLALLKTEWLEDAGHPARAGDVKLTISPVC